jgi:hypothetical protein
LIKAPSTKIENIKQGIIRTAIHLKSNVVVNVESGIIHVEQDIKAIKAINCER